MRSIIKKTFLVSVLTNLLVQTLSAQSAADRIRGKVLNSTNDTPLETVSVQLLQKKLDSSSKLIKESILTGMFTDKKGEFYFEIPFDCDSVHLQLSAIGYKKVDTIFSTASKAQLASTNEYYCNIKMQADTTVLVQVTVTATRNLMQFGIDRKMFNVEKSISSIGGTAVDVLRNVPLVSVDINGNVILRNNAPQIFIDGKPATMSPDQIPADAVQSVELITNPSARFDASGGTSGIINIVLKKNRRMGYNGDFRMGLNSKMRMNLGGNINLRQGKINLFLDGNFAQRKTISIANGNRITLNPSDSSTVYQDETITDMGQFKFLRAGFDYLVDRRNTITITTLTSLGEFTPFTRSQLLLNRLGSNKPDTVIDRLFETDGRFGGFRELLSFKHNFPKPGHEFTADISISQNKNRSSSSAMSTSYVYKDGPDLGSYTQLQYQEGSTESVIFQTDYVNPIKENSKLEAGTALTVRRTDNENVTGLPGLDGTISKLDSLSARYINRDYIYATYAIFSNQVKKFGYQFGLRLQSSGYHAELLRKFAGQENSNSFTNSLPFSLFPSIFLSEKIKNGQELQGSYTRRMNRPLIFQLSPFLDFTDSLNLTQGNPSLGPEFTNSFEISYQKIYKGNSNLLLSIYYKNTTNMISIYTYDTLLGGQHRILNSYVNAKSSNNYGFEIIMQNTITKWWDVNTNFNIFSSKIRSTISDKNSEQNRIISYFIKVNNNIRFLKNFALQLNADYISRRTLPPGGRNGGSFYSVSQSSSQAYLDPNLGVDLALRYNFLKEKRASIAISVNDVLRTRKIDIHSQSLFFVQNTFRTINPQLVRINFSWKFGKVDANFLKRKNMRAEQEGGQEGQ